MAKTRLREAIASAQRHQADQDLKPLVDSIVAGVAKVIMSQLKQNPDRTDEILEALVAREEAVIAAVTAAMPEIPEPAAAPPPADLAPLTERIQKLEKLLKQTMDNIVLTSGKTPWRFEHVHDRAGRFTETIARPMNGD